MPKKFYGKKVCSFFIALFFLSITLPAQAFYLEVPDKVINALKSIRNQGKVLGETAINENVETLDPTNSYMSPPTETSPAETCNINGTEMPGRCSNYSSPQPDNTEQWQKNDTERQAQDEQRQKEDEERRKKDEERWLNDVRRGNKEMEKNLTRLSGMFKKAEKDGTEIPTEIKEKLAQAKKLLNP